MLSDVYPNLGRPTYADEEWDFPPLDGDPAAAAKLWAEIELAATRANRIADRLKARKAAAKAATLAAIENSPYTSVTVPLPNGREIRVTPYDREFFHVKDEVVFKAWAAGDLAPTYPEVGAPLEQMYTREPRLREDTFRDEMRRRSQDHEPLPPGVERYQDNRISRTAVPQRKQRR